MTTQSTPTPPIAKIITFLPITEKIFLSALAIGFVLYSTNIDSQVMKVSALGLSFIFFFSQFVPLEIRYEENEVLGFRELLGCVIAPKILWISCAVSMMGVFLWLLESKGYKQMLYIGGTSLAVASFVVIFLTVTGTRHTRVVVPILYRAIPLLVVDLYLFFK